MIGTGLSLWLIPLILVLSLGISIWFYRNDVFLKDASKSIRMVLFSLRFLLVFTIGLLLLKPFSKHLQSEFYQPELIVLHDQSQSLRLSKDSTYDVHQFAKERAEWIQSLKDADIPVRMYGFSDSLYQNFDTTYQQEISNISAALQQVFGENAGKTVGGMVVISDGIYNRGEDPVYRASQCNYPIYTVGLGDTSSSKDIRVSLLEINKVAYSNQNIPFKLDILGDNLPIGTGKFTIKINGKTIKTETFQVKQSHFFGSFTQSIAALPVGMHLLNVELESFDGEYNLVNNRRSVYIEVVDSKQKILVLFDAPHPDIAAIRSSLDQLSHIECNYQSVGQFDGKIEPYHLIVLHQLPSTSFPLSELIQKSQKMGISLWSVVSNSTDLKSLQNIHPLIKWSKVHPNAQFTNSQINSAFNLFGLESGLIQFMEKAPPLWCPSIKINSTEAIQVLSNQTIKAIPNGQAQIFFAENEFQKLGFIVGEGIWKWKMYNYKQEQNTIWFDQIIQKTSQFLLAKAIKDLLRVDVQNQYTDYESVQINAQYLNPSFEPVIDAHLAMELTHNNNSPSHKTMVSGGTSHSLKLGRLEPGLYRYKVYPTAADGQTRIDKIEKSGQFVVEATDIEFENLTANHQLLNQISEQTGGFLANKHQLKQLADSIIASDQFKPRQYSTEEVSDWIEIKWLLFLLVALATAEWFIRKWNGTV